MLTTRNVERFNVLLDSRLVKLNDPLKVTLNGKEKELRLQPRFVDLCRSLVERGDPRLAFTVRLSFEGDQE